MSGALIVMEEAVTGIAQMECSRTAMHRHVLRIGQNYNILVRVALVLGHIKAQHELYFMIVTLHMAIIMGVVCATVKFSDTHDMAHDLVRKYVTN